MTDSFELFIAIITATLLSVVGLIIASIINSAQLRGQKNQLAITNFREIMSYIDDEETKKFTNWLLNDDKKRTLFEKFKKEYGSEYNKKEHDDEIKEVEKAVWHLASRYDRLGVLLDKDKEIRKRALDYHDRVISKLWLTLESIIDTRETIEKDGAYKYFRKIGIEAIENKYSLRKNESNSRRDRYLIIISVVSSAYVMILYEFVKELLSPTPNSPNMPVVIGEAGTLSVIFGVVIIIFLAWKKI